MAESDYVRLLGGPLDSKLYVTKQWPPPEVIEADGVVFDFEGGRYERLRMSALTDEEIASMSHVARGAEYEWKAS